MFNKCPGSLGNTPTLKIKKCPECGGDVEVFSNDVQVKCEGCGFPVYNDLESCIQWCKYAKECVGEELYNKLKKKRIAFLGRENSCRSVMAEALAKGLGNGHNLGFVSAGTHPGQEVDRQTLVVLRNEGIAWNGKPKDISRIGPVDVVVLMGKEVEPPETLDAKIITWDIPDPRGKGVEEYRRTLRAIKQKITELMEEEVV